MAGGIRQYSWAIDLAGILACAFLLARVTAVYLGRSLEIKRSVAVLRTAEMAPSYFRGMDRSNYQVIIDRNIFDASPPTEISDEDEDEIAEEDEIRPTGEAVLTNLDIKVMGVLVVGDGTDSRSSATIAGGVQAAPPPPVRGRAGPAPSAAASVHAVGDVDGFAPNTLITRIQPDRIEFMNSGRLEYAEVLAFAGLDIFGPPISEPVAAAPPSAPPSPRDASTVRKDEPGRFTVDQREINDALQNIDRLYTEIRAVPNFAGGKVSGMKILSVKSDSIFAKLGLRRGDVLHKINGMELDVRKGFEIFNVLKDEKNIQLDLVRQGQPTSLEYEIR